jgi:hypothetical protein
LTGLNLANSLSIYLLELSSLLTGTFNHFLTKPNHQRNSLHNRCRFHSKLHPCYQLRLPNRETIRISLITNNLLPIYSLSQDQVDNNHRTNTTLGHVKRLITRSYTQVSSKDVARSVAKPKPWSQSWHQGHFHQNNPLQTHLQTKEHHLNCRDPMVILSSAFVFRFSSQETYSHRLNFLAT